MSIQTFEFDVPETADYVIAFYTDAAKNADFVLGTLTLQALEFTPTGITDATSVSKATRPQLFDLAGRQIGNGQWTMNNGQLPKGIYIENGRKRYAR